ncbi:MAG: HEAT repeat domain-containing protein, partial [Planctomycetes bacterium]|nr:HEAT repeat domain-containing protein [Planctomycetota bacterium]
MKRTLLALTLFAIAASGAVAQRKYEPAIAKASEDGRRQMSGFQIDGAFEARLWAAEPQLANPVCFWVDARGRVFVGETYRQEQGGVPDNRSFGFWLKDDLKNQTLADRRAMYLTHRPQYAMQFTEHHDRITLLEDRDGDGEADASKVFADGFNDILDGTGAGILTRGSDVYYACIPNLWRLRDTNDDGVADRREILHSGYGIRIALRGHDLHGLVMGPDGRLYFSIGDRGYNILTREGKHLKCPWSGAVFRCELDGSNLEVFATGLRNPQELAFDDLGNLFTGDNNSDSEDKARIVYVVEGGETGWRMNFQYRGDRGGWVSEGWWKTRHEGQAPFLIPPLTHIGSGPSGFTSYPGTGLPSRYDGSFLMCDFRGGRTNSGIWSFKFEPDGAGYKVVGNEHLLWGSLATDCDFGPDGTLFVSDWVAGWVGVGKGRIYTFRHKDAEARKAGAATAKLLGGDWSKHTVPALAALLGNPDRRVRLEAQYELVNRGGESIRFMKAIAQNKSEGRLARIHALWGLGQIARRDSFGLMQLSEMAPLASDADAEIRAQVVKLLGEHPNAYVDHAPVMRAGLGDQSPRVRYFAALNLGRFGSKGDVPHLLALARENADKDVYLRHACIMGLVRIGDADALLACKDDASPAARLVAVLALRRLKDTRVSEFLKDADGYVATAASRAIYDVPIDGAYAALAGMLRQQELP